MASGVLAESALTLVTGYSNLWAKIQYRQKESSTSGKVVLQARMYYKWNAGAASTFNSCVMQIATGNYPGTGGTLVKTQSYSWTRTATQSECYTDWYDVSTWDNMPSIILYARVEAATSSPEWYQVTVNGIKFSYDLTTTPDSGCTIVVSRQSSGVGSTGTVTSGGILYAGDSIKISAAPKTNYQIKTLTVNGSSFQSGNTHTVSGSVTIAATSQVLASSVGATDADIESVSTIIVTKYSTNYYHSLQFTFGSLTGYISSDGSVSNTEVKYSTTSIAFKVPNTFYAQIPSAKYGTCTITCRTYASASSTTVLGAPTTCTFRATASEDTSAPTVFGSVVDTNTNTIALTQNSSTVVRFLSNAQCTIAAGARNGASITKKYINGVEVSGDIRSITGDDLTQSTFTFSATDSRGYTTTHTITANMIQYTKLTCNPIFYRPTPTTGEVSLTFNGNAYTGEWRDGVSNTLTIRYRYRELSNPTFGTWKTISDSYTIQTSRYSTTSAIALTDYNNRTTGFDYTKSYVFEIEVSEGDGPLGDSEATIVTTVTKQVTVQEGIPVFDWGKNDFSLHVPFSIQDVDSASAAITIGNTSITEEQLRRLLALL